LPVHPDFDSADRDGPTVRDDDSPVQADLRELVDSVADRVGEVNRRKVAEAAGDDDGEQVPVEEAT
jgi:ATP-binding protein involved in chromosome partitioning